MAMVQVTPCMMPSPRIGGPPHPTALLRHELPDGSHHYDWLLARDPHGTQPLMTFRLPRPVDELMAGESVRAQHLDDHRPEYLQYEGPVSGKRGSVRRVRNGWLRQCDLIESSNRQWHITIDWRRRGEDAATPFGPKAEPRGGAPIHPAGLLGGGEFLQCLRLIPEQKNAWRIIALSLTPKVGHNVQKKL